METIKRFIGSYQFLSNFYPCEVTYNGRTYSSVEVAFQCEKCANEEDRETISEMKPVNAKRYGRKIQQKENWHEIKLKVMHELVRAKFEQNKDLKEKLLATGDAELVEGNYWHDKFWGADIKTLEGENHLGKILMSVRNELKQS